MNARRKLTAKMIENINPTAKMIEVMQAYVDGQDIEARERSYGAGFAPVLTPFWDWDTYEYRIKIPKPYIDWSVLNDTYNYLAKDSDEAWYLFGAEPTLSEHGSWTPKPDDNYILIKSKEFCCPLAGAVLPEGIPWDQSLVKRPGIE